MIAKMLVWIVLYPIMLLSFLTTSLWSIVTFLFHSPVDVWIMISKAVDQAVEEQ